MKVKPLHSIKTVAKSGKEEFVIGREPVGTILYDFWRWSTSNLLSNATRGVLAEFIVGTAVGINRNTVRDEWAPVDLETEDGIKIEVKSSSYIQSWAQEKLSNISFSIKPARAWDDKTGKHEEKPRRHADVYVFCLLSHKDQETINPLKLEQWDFFVLPTIKLDKHDIGKKNITLNTLRKLSEPVSYQDLKSEIELSYNAQQNLLDNLGVNRHD